MQRVSCATVTGRRAARRHCRFVPHAPPARRELFEPAARRDSSFATKHSLIYFLSSLPSLSPTSSLLAPSECPSSLSRVHDLCAGNVPLASTCPRSPPHQQCLPSTSCMINTSSWQRSIVATAMSTATRAPSWYARTLMVMLTAARGRTDDARPCQGNLPGHGDARQRDQCLAVFQ